MDESSAASVAKTAEREREKKKQRADTAASDSTSKEPALKDVKQRSRARSIWGRKK